MIQLRRSARPSLLIALLTQALISCAHDRHWAERIAWDDLEFSNLPGSEQYPGADAVILLDDVEMSVVGSGELTYSELNRHRIVKIFTARGQRYANIAVPYSPDDEVVFVQARTISPEGEISVIEKNDIFDINLYPDFVFYSDQRAKLFAVPAVENGSVVEYRYKLRIQDPTFWHAWAFQATVPTRLSRFTLVAPSEWEIDYKVYGLDLEPKFTEYPEGFKSTYVWEAWNVPALKSEFGMPPTSESMAKLILSPVGIKTWEDVAEWYRGLSEPQIEARQGVKELASALTEGLETDEDKLRVLYEWVRDRIRYVAVEIGIGGYKPHSAEEVLKNRYGDCKDMATLLCSLAREVGLEAYEVIVSTKQHGIPDTSLASPYHFNHMIAYSPSVGGKGVWMDVTEKGCPFGSLPWYDQRLPVLVVANKGEAGIFITPGVSPDSNRVFLDWDLRLLPTGAATIQGKTFLWGALATELREDLYYSSQEARQQWLETYLARRCSGAKVDSFSIEGLNPISDPLTVSYSFRTASFAVSRFQEMTFRPASILAFILPDYFRSPERTHPIRFQYGIRRELDLTVEIPIGYEVNLPDSTDLLSSSFGSASMSWVTTGTVCRVRAKYRLNGDDVSPPNYQSFQNFIDSIQDWEMREVIISKR